FGGGRLFVDDLEAEYARVCPCGSMGVGRDRKGRLASDACRCGSGGCPGRDPFCQQQPACLAESGIWTFPQEELNKRLHPRNCFRSPKFGQNNASWIEKIFSGPAHLLHLRWRPLRRVWSSQTSALISRF